MEKMTMERRNEISHMLVVDFVRRKGLPTLRPDEIKEQIFEDIEKIELTFGEASEYVRGIVLALVEDAFPDPEAKKPLLGPAFTEEKPTEVPSVPDETKQKKPILGHPFTTVFE